MLCFHDRMKQFIFSEDAGGQTIKMCPDCTSFDAQRVAVLKTGHIDTPDATLAQRWDIILDDAGLSMDAGKGIEDFIMYEADIIALQPHKHVAVAPRTPLDDHLWQEKLTPFPHTRSMPRLLTNFCVHCREYAPINHLCEPK